LHEDQKNTQAEKLQQLFREVNNQEMADKQTEKESTTEFVEVDVLQLPPRSEVHQTSKWSTHINISSPWVRFSFIVFLLLVILFIAYFPAGDKIIIFFT